MKLQEIFDQLTYGELSNLAIGGSAEGEISEANYPRILAHINLGLTALYRRFPLKEGSVRIQLQPNQIAYHVHSDYAVGNRRARASVKYVQDSITSPFSDDILKIEKAFTDTDIELELNNSLNTYSVMTPTSNTIRVPEVLVDGSLDTNDDLYTTGLMLFYRANHSKLVVTQGLFDPARIDVELPQTHLEPLLLYVASRVNNPIGMTNEFNAGNNYAAKYEASCQRLEIENLRVDQGSQGNRLHSKGFV
jgi:hypothetical protein